MNHITFKTLSSLLLASGALYAGGASAALTGTQTATVDFQGVAAATYGWTNVTPSLANPSTPIPIPPSGYFAGDAPNNNAFVQNGIAVGGVQEPTDSGSHYHRQGTSADREAQYHPDSSGIYVRLNDQVMSGSTMLTAPTNFSLQNIYLNVTNGEAGGNFVLYGYANAINNGLLTAAGATTGGYGSSSDPEGGWIAPIASYLVPNDGSFDGNITFAQLSAADSDWGNIGAFWLTFQGFNHSPTANYALGSYPDWDIRVDDIVLGAAVSQVPVPGAVWLFGTGLLGLMARGRKIAA